MRAIARFVDDHFTFFLVATFLAIGFGMAWVIVQNEEYLKTGCKSAGGSYRIIGEDHGTTTRRCVDRDGKVVPFEYPR